MSVGAPVLERNPDTQEREYNVYTNSFLSAEERHNSLISEKYAKLINPESKPHDIISSHRTEERNYTELNTVPIENDIFARKAVEQKPYLVENARADADIFRADSPINRKTVEVAESPSVSQSDEEENEDLRPTQTTIQYKTAGLAKSGEEGKIETKNARVSKLALTKKDRLIIAVALTIILALFVLIIVNSAVISNLNRDVSTLQATLNEAQETYTQIEAEKAEYLDEDNLYQRVSEFAQNNGMILED